MKINSKQTNNHLSFLLQATASTQFHQEKTKAKHGKLLFFVAYAVMVAFVVLLVPVQESDPSRGNSMSISSTEFEFYRTTVLYWRKEATTLVPEILCVGILTQAKHWQKCINPSPLVLETVGSFGDLKYRCMPSCRPF